MITPALHEPQPGWITNVYGPTAFVSANIKGICKLACADNESNGDCVPVDFVVNGCLAAGMKTAVDAKDNRLKLGLRLNTSRLSMDEVCANSEGYSSQDSSTADEETTSSISSGNVKIYFYAKKYAFPIIL